MGLISGIPLGIKAVEVTKHAIMRTISVVCVIAVIGGLIWSVYVTLIKPHTKPNPTTTENAQIIYHFTINVPSKRVFGLGGTLWGMDIGLVKYDYTSSTITLVKEIMKNDISNVTAKVIKEVDKPKHRKWYFLWLL